MIDSGKPHQDSRNIAILAHVDAGKTTVSERLLYFSDTISGTGEVDEGLATMDYLDEEKRRGITIEAGIAAYTWKRTKVTFVDTPGHVDFGVEVDFALRSVEGVVLVLSGVSGIESQSLEAWEKVRAHGNVPLVFVNKLDLPGADHRKVMEQIEAVFGRKPVALTLPIHRDGRIDGVVDLIHELALYRSKDNPRRIIKGQVPASVAEEYAACRQALLDAASRHNDAVLQGYLEGSDISHDTVTSGIREAVLAGEIVPVIMGSALKNVGIRQLMNAVRDLLPAPAIPPDAEEKLGFVLKVRWYRGIGKIYLAKLYAASALRSLEDVTWFRVFAESLQPLQEAQPGDIVALKTPHPYAVGQWLRPSSQAPTRSWAYRPLLQSRLEPETEEEFPRIEAVLRQLADTEPSIAIETDPETGAWLVSTVGELQLEVFCRRLQQEHDCRIRIGPPRVRYQERLRAGMETWEHQAQGFGAEITLNLKAEPLPHEEDGNRLTCIPEISQKNQEILESVFGTFCSQGVCGYGSISGLSVALGSIRSNSDPIPPPLLAKAFADALQLSLICANFEVLEPIMRLEIIVPEEYCGAVLADLAGRGGVVRKLDADGRNSIILIEIPLESTFGYTTLLRSLSRGFGVFVLTYEKHGVKRKG